MKKLSRIVALGSMALASSSAYAIDMPDLSAFYYHVQYSMLSADVSNTNGSGSASLKGVTLEVGTQVYSHEVADVFLEAVATLGLGSETAFGYSGSSRYQADVSRIIGVQAKAYRQLAEKFAGFFNLGLMNVSTTVISETCVLSICASNTPDADDSAMGINYSFGGEYQLNKSTAITLSYNSLPGVDAGISSVDITSLNLGYKSRF